MNDPVVTPQELELWTKWYQSLARFVDCADRITRCIEELTVMAREAKEHGENLGIAE